MSENEMIIPELNKETIESMIYTIRGQKVMLDFELAKIYGYSTRAFNQQVKNNIEKFPERYRFMLTKQEVDDLVKSKFLTSRNDRYFQGQSGGTRKLPYAFTEQGIYMLMTVLKGDLATRQSIALIDAFKQMKDYLVENNGLVGANEVIKLVNTVKNHSIKIDNIEAQLTLVMDNFIDSSTYKHYLILDGQKIEADIAYQEIYSKAKNSIIIIDDYIDIKTLKLLKVCKKNIDIKIFSDNKAKNKLDATIVKDFVDDTKLGIEIRSSNNRFHDRYIVLDYNTKEEKIYHCGASSKDAGSKITTIVQLSDLRSYHQLLGDIFEEIKMGAP